MTGLRITHYGLANLDFSSYFTSGLQLFAAKRGDRFRVVRSMPAELAQALGDLFSKGSITTYEARSARGAVRFCIDGMDNAEYIHKPLLDEVDAYFKVNLCNHALTAVEQKDKVLPCLPFFPIAASKFTHRPRVLPHAHWEKRLMQRQIRQLRAERPTVGDLRELRSKAKRLDVAFVVPYYDDPRHCQNNNFRYEVMRELERASDINAVYGFVGKSVPAPYDEYHISRISMRAHLERSATARVGIYVHGLHGCISYKFGELLALGLPVAGQPIPNHLGRFTHLPGFSEQFSARNPGALVEAVGALLSDPDRREDLGESNAQVFDHVFAPECVAAEIINCVERLL